MLALGLVCMKGMAIIPTDHFTYKGTLGNVPIVIEIVDDQLSDERRTGRYFFPSEHVTRPLSGLVNELGIVLKLGNRADDPPPWVEKTLILHGSLGNRLYGEWRENNAAPVSVVLSPVKFFPEESDVASAPPFMQTVYHTLTYDALFQQGHGAKVVKQGKVGQFAVEWWQDPLTRSSMFQVTSGYSAEQGNQLNEILGDTFWRTLSDMSTCVNAGGLKVKIGLLSPNAVSYTLTGKFQCPDDEQPQIRVFTHTSTLRNDSSTLRGNPELLLSDLFWLDDLPVPVMSDEYDNGDDYGEMRLQERLPEWLKSQFTQLYPTKMTHASGATGEGCDYTATQTWANTRWSFTPEGIYFQPLRPDGTDVCDDEGWEVVPWRIVNKHPGRLQYVTVP
ncbi:hypothetical protein [Dickeya dadantii]|uniref:hypothetical protein n=1 Tax=Dickeya dadantii TaxID=204038 RepID=UPI0021DB0997|nr:hypothetical protein [Dickeya dadantii]